MSIRLISRSWDFECQSHTEKLVLLALCDSANDQGECYPSIGTIARKSQMSDRAVQSKIRDLEARGILKVDRSQGQRRSNLYCITLPAEGERGAPGGVNVVHPNHKGTTVSDPSGTRQNESAREALPVLAPSEKKKQKDEMPPIPASLESSPEFLAIWAAWLADRKDRRKPVTARAAQMQLADLAAWGPEGAVKSLKQSIARGYSGVFPPKMERPAYNGNPEPLFTHTREIEI